MFDNSSAGDSVLLHSFCNFAYVNSRTGNEMSKSKRTGNEKSNANANISIGPILRLLQALEQHLENHRIFSRKAETIFRSALDRLAIYEDHTNEGVAWVQHCQEWFQLELDLHEEEIIQLIESFQELIEGQKSEPSKELPSRLH
jgi:hypothetical protein